MAKYVCPSCGAAFNGKKCRQCLYEALAESQLPRIHREASPRRPEPDIRTSPRETSKKKTTSGKETRRRPKWWIMLLFVLFFGWPLLQFLLLLFWNFVSMIVFMR